MSDKFRDSLTEKDQQWLDAIREHNAAERAMRLKREAQERKPPPRHIWRRMWRSTLLGELSCRLLGTADPAVQRVTEVTTEGQQ